MRTHTEIMQSAGGAAKVRDIIGIKNKNLSVFQSWLVRSSIPPGYWNLFAKHGIATLQELADAAEAQLLAETPP